MWIQFFRRMLCILIVGLLAGLIFSPSTVGRVGDAWWHNRWTINLLKVAFQSTSIQKSIEEKGLKQFERMSLGQQVDISRSLIYIGRVYEQFGDRGAAIQSYERALASQDTINQNMYFQISLSQRLGHLLYEQELYSEAIPILQDGIALFVTNDPVYVPLIVQMYWDLAESVYANGGDKSTYEQYMLLALVLSPSNAGLNQALTEHYLGWNDLENATTLNKSWKAVSPESALPVFYTGRIYQLKGDCNKAQIYYREAINLEPNDLLSHFWLAMCDEQLGDSESAILEFRRAIDLAPSEWWIYRQLGNTLINNGKYVEAQEILIKGLSLNPQDGWTQQLLDEAKRLSSQNIR